MQDKVNYVLSQPQTRRHECHWPGCQEHIPPAMWGCRQHWFKLPRQIRNKIWAAYVPGQEKNMRPSQAYIKAAREAQEWIKSKG